MENNFQCTKCDRKIARDGLKEHLRECGSGAEFVPCNDAVDKVFHVIGMVFMMTLTCLLVAAGIYLSDFGLQLNKEVRQIERIPQTVIAAVLPGEVSVVGQAVKHAKTIRSPHTGTELAERTRIATFSLMAIWAGLVCLATAVALFCRALNYYRVVVYAALLALVLSGTLCVLGGKVLCEDLGAASARLARHEEAAAAVISREFGRIGLGWDGAWGRLGSFSEYRAHGLSPATVERLERIRLDLASTTLRFRRQYDGVPDRWLGSLLGIARPEPIPLPGSVQVDLAAQDTAFRKAAIPFIPGMVVILATGLGSLVAFLSGLGKARTMRHIENIATTPAAAAVFGMGAFKGIVSLPDDQTPLKGPLSEADCVQYRYEVKEWQGGGEHAELKTRFSETISRAFQCMDGDGVVWVDPDKAEVFSLHETNRSPSKDRFSYTETRIELNDPIYVLGECRVEPAAGESLYVRKPECDMPFIVSNLPEETVWRKMGSRGLRSLNNAFIGALLALLVAGGLQGSFAAASFFAAATAPPLLLLLVMMVMHYNDLIFLRELANRNWANIEVSLKKRLDLMPNLERTVKHFMRHEQELQRAITALRRTLDAGAIGDPAFASDYIPTEKMVMNRLLARLEAYPDLLADKQAARLMETAMLLENEIAFMQAGYNNAVENYNTRIQSFPDMLVARINGFHVKPFIESIGTETRQMPVVRFAFSGAAAAESPIPPEDVGFAPADHERSLREARAVIYALALNRDDATRHKQLADISDRDCPECAAIVQAILDAVEGEAPTDLKRLMTAEAWLPRLANLSAAGYRRFIAITHGMAKADAVLSHLEYALLKSIAHRLTPVFTQTALPTVRHKTMEMLIRPASVLISTFAGIGADAATAQSAFEQIRARLRVDGNDRLYFVPAEECTLAAFDAALDELAHAVEQLKSDVFNACAEMVTPGDCAHSERGLLLAAMADTLNLDRPAGLEPEPPGS